MKPEIKSLLLPFHFGSIEDNDRILVERELLIDSEVLVDYLDLKRALESAQAIPQSPSKATWLKLQEKVQAKKKYIIPMSFVAALAASVFIAVMFFRQPDQAPVNSNYSSGEILFDTRTELPANSNVL